MSHYLYIYECRVPERFLNAHTDTSIETSTVLQAVLEHEELWLDPIDGPALYKVGRGPNPYQRMQEYCSKYSLEPIENTLLYWQTQDKNHARAFERISHRVLVQKGYVRIGKYEVFLTTNNAWLPAHYELLSIFGECDTVLGMRQLFDLVGKVDMTISDLLAL
ncbi:hypothetical protein [Ferrimonas balearica]|uniref:hypothetical protein n=1 Tax=Ferrimonas balearica TaxID=44012 RepID=UPI001C978DC9|nr:hypothetical protein [Ferrimonas balearica]MBY6223040.1 hypothetical protein [Ferrimonas balearica]